MKEKYTKPEIEIIEIEVEDVITTSALGKALPGDHEIGF